MQLLHVIIPTTHRVEKVAHLLALIRKTAPCQIRTVVVDNSPRANREDWVSAGIDCLSVSQDYLGSGESFRRGISAALEDGASWVLLLDHDAGLGETTIRVLLEAAEETSASAFSCNQNGDGSGWSALREGNVFRSDHADDATSAWPELYQWSGLLLAHDAAQLVAGLRTDYFFTWDDYLMSHYLATQGIRAVGVRGAQVDNHRAAAAPAWRGYYETRNHFLFLRDVGALSPRSMFRCSSERVRVGFGQLRRGHRHQAWAVFCGLWDGVRGRRGASPRFLP